MRDEAKKIILNSAMFLLLLLLSIASYMTIRSIYGLIPSLILGLYIVYIGSEVSVYGFKEAAYHLGSTLYMAGLISSFASNLPELVVSSLLVYHGVKQGLDSMVETAILTVIMAVGFNALLLGFLILIVTRKVGAIPFPYTAIKHESDLIRMTIVVSFLIFALGVLEMGNDKIGVLPRELGFFMLIIYAAYILIMARSQKERRQEKPTIGRLKTVLILVLGIAMVFVGGELLTWIVDLLLSHSSLSLVTIALILAFSGSIPEHVVGLIGTFKGRIELGLGNLIAGMTQSILVVFAFISLLIPVPLDGYVIFQLISAAGVLWIIKKSIIDDSQLTADEGIFIILLQLLLFVMLEELRL